MPVSEILFAAVADAVFSYLLEQSGLADRVRAVLKIDPQRKAFQAALARAYTAFKRQYPDWAEAFFDKTFLTREDVVAELAQLLTRRRAANPAAIAHAWGAYFAHNDPERRQELIAEITPAVANFLTWLEAELAEQPALQALYDSRALERIAANTEALLRYFVEPVRALPTDYAAHIEEFLTAYLGTPERPVPFGGREDALATLDAWLEDTAMPYLLLTAPAGLGKSALLVRWLVRLRETRPDLPTVFVPVSIRYSTNLSTVTFAALAAQLARVYGEEVPTDPNTPAPVWKGICASYLRREPPGGRLLVVLDGLDEAADWDVDAGLFPQAPPPGLKVAVSARLTATRSRPQDWRYALGWERLPVREMPLEPLTRGGLRDVLERMGVPLDELARRPFIVEELHRLTGGDPLLTRFYVEDLWGRQEEALRLRPEDLRHLKPGYEGYFQQWWEDQRKLWGRDYPLKEQAVQEVLNLLATALGPLPGEALLELAHPDANLTTWTLDEALRPLARFVVHTEAGYVFGHPKLGDFFFGRLTRREQQDLEARFLAWGKATLQALAEGTLAPREAPAYVVRYYRAHLVRAGVPLSDLQALVHSRAWAQAWEALQGSYSGYLNDVEEVRKQAVAMHQGSTGDRPLPHLDLEIRCALIEASIHSLAANLPPELPGLLLQNDLWTPAQALAHVRQMPDSKQQAQALAALAPILVQKAPQWLEEALAAARSIKWEYARARALAALAPHLPDELREEVLREALAAARSIEREYNRAEALAALAPHLPQEVREKVLGEALAAARSIRDEDDRAEALAALAPHLPDELREEVLREALAAARSIRDEDDRARALAGLAPHLPQELLGEALAAARSIEWEYARAEALAALAPHLPQDLLGEALAAAQAIGDEHWRAGALAGLAPHLPQELLEEALAAARSIGNEYDRARALAALAPHLAALPRPILYPLWAETLPTLARRTRRDLLFDLRALEEVVYALGGEAAIAETFRAIQDVGRWWP